MRKTRDPIQYFTAIMGPHRYQLAVVDTTRGKRWAYAFECLEDEIRYAIVDPRVRWNDRAVLELWATIDVESPDTLVEAHQRGWVNAFQIHAFARTHGYFGATQRHHEGT